MKASLLAELSDLFTREAFEKDKRGDHDEAERLWDISEEIHTRRMNTERAEAGRPIR
jgi:hypothetical protein